MKSRTSGANAAVAAGARASKSVAVQGGRRRWRMGVDARALVIVTAALLAFGVAVLYSASALVAQRDGHGSTFFLLRQLGGIGIGVVLFAIAAKMDAERWR